MDGPESNNNNLVAAPRMEPAAREEANQDRDALVELTDLEEKFLGLTAGKKRSLRSLSHDQREKLSLFREMWTEKERLLEAVTLSKGLEESSLLEPPAIQTELVNNGGWLITGVSLLYVFVIAFCVAVFAVSCGNDSSTASQVAAGFAVGAPWLSSTALFLWFNSKYLSYNYFGAERVHLRFLLCGAVWAVPVFFGFGVILYTVVSSRIATFVIVVYSTYFGCALISLLCILVNASRRYRTQRFFFNAILHMKLHNDSHNGDNLHSGFFSHVERDRSLMLLPYRDRSASREARRSKMEPVLHLDAEDTETK